MFIKSIGKLVMVSALVAGFLASTAMAVENEGDSSVNLVATLRNGPAMRPVDWKIYRVDNNSVVTSTRSHSLSLPLRPGTYKAVAKLNDVTRNRTFTINSSGQVNVVIAMDN